MNSTIDAEKTKFRVADLLYKHGGRRYYLNIRNKVLREFLISANTWDLWCKKKINTGHSGDFPAEILLYLAKEMKVSIECLFTVTNEEKCLEL